MDITIIDLDNCISDDRWRKKFILPLKEGETQWKRHLDYHTMCHLDEFVNVDIITPHLVNFVVFTGRSDDCRDMTVDWMKRKKIPQPFGLFMREVNDHRPAVDVKRDMLAKLRMFGHNPIRAFDDCMDICEMYIAEGVKHVHRLTVKGKNREITQRT